MQIVGRCRFSRFPGFKAAQDFGVLEDFAPRQFWPRHRSDGLAGSGCLQIGLGCKFCQWADRLIVQDQVLPRSTPLPDFATAQVQVTSRFQNLPGLHAIQQILAARISRFADLPAAQI